MARWHGAGDDKGATETSLSPYEGDDGKDVNGPGGPVRERGKREKKAAAFLLFFFFLLQCSFSTEFLEEEKRRENKIKGQILFLPQKYIVNI